MKPIPEIVNKIKENCSKTLGFPVSEFETKTRRYDVALSRAIISYYLSNVYGMTTLRIKDYVGRTRHAVMHHCEMIDKILDCDIQRKRIVCRIITETLIWEGYDLIESIGCFKNETLKKYIGGIVQYDNIENYRITKGTTTPTVHN